MKPKCNCGWSECSGKLIDDTWIHSGTTIKNGVMRTWHSISCYYCQCSPSEPHKDDCPKKSEKKC